MFVLKNFQTDQIGRKQFYKSHVVGINWGDQTTCRRDGLLCVYKDMWEAAIGEVLLCSREPTNIGELFGIISCKKFSYIFCVRKYFYNGKKANYGIMEPARIFMYKLFNINVELVSCLCCVVQYCHRLSRGNLGLPWVLWHGTKKRRMYITIPRSPLRRPLSQLLPIPQSPRDV